MNINYYQNKIKQFPRFFKEIQKCDPGRITVLQTTKSNIREEYFYRLFVVKIYLPWILYAKLNIFHHGQLLENR